MMTLEDQIAYLAQHAERQIVQMRDLHAKVAELRIEVDDLKRTQQPPKRGPGRPPKTRPPAARAMGVGGVTADLERDEAKSGDE